MNDARPSDMAQAFERSILKGISIQWDHFFAFLGVDYRALFKKPRFTLAETRQKLGRWSPDKREIMLSRDLVFNHAWDAVVDVLRHEMAHQFADEILNGTKETEHGPSFLKACKLLKANPLASGYYKPLHERVKGESLNDQDKMMVKIQKLLSLATSKNRNEAEIAMAKAHELIQKYNIDLAGTDQKNSFESIFLGKPSLRHFRDDYHLSSLICDYYFVEGVWIIAYVIEKEAMGRVLEISGTKTNLIIADYVYHFIRRYMDAEWQAYNSDKQLNRYRKTDFCVGIINGFREKLKKNAPPPEKNLSRSTALVKLKDPFLDHYMKDRYPNLRTTRSNNARMDMNVLNDGHAVGQKMVISNGITENKGNRGLMIGHHGAGVNG